MSKITLIASAVLFIVLLVSGNYLYDSIKNYGKDCNPNYSGCVTGVNCSDVDGSVRVIGDDVFGLDRDGDGKGCEPSKYSKNSGSFDIIRILILLASGYLSYRFFYYLTEKTAKRIVKMDSGNKPKRTIDSNTNVAALNLLGACPKCGKNLISRHGKYGSFIGCSGYPDCKFSKKPQ